MNNIWYNFKYYNKIVTFDLPVLYSPQERWTCTYSRPFYLLELDPDPGGLFTCGSVRIRIRNTAENWFGFFITGWTQSCDRPPSRPRCAWDKPNRTQGKAFISSYRASTFMPGLPSSSLFKFLAPRKFRLLLRLQKWFWKILLENTTYRVTKLYLFSIIMFLPYLIEFLNNCALSSFEIFLPFFDRISGVWAGRKNGSSSYKKLGLGRLQQPNEPYLYYDSDVKELIFRSSGVEITPPCMRLLWAWTGACPKPFFLFQKIFV